MASPKVKETVRPEDTKQARGANDSDLIEITAEEHPELYALASQAMEEVRKGDVEPWP